MKSVFRKICQNNSQLAEPKFSGKYTQKPYVDGTNKGMYVCPCCENPLYSSRDAFDSTQDCPHSQIQSIKKDYQFLNILIIIHLLKN